MEQVQTSVTDLASMVHELLEGSEDVSRRLATVESSISVPKRTSRTGNQSIRSRDKTFLEPSTAYQDQSEPVQSDTVPQPPEVARGIQAHGLHIEPLLQRSRVYLRAFQRHSISSLPSSSAHSKCGWSMLSDISLAEISNISVLSLPLSASELWSSQHFSSLPKPQVKMLLPGEYTDSIGSLWWRVCDVPLLMIVGMEGSGKSTIVKLLRMILKGKEVGEDERREARLILGSNLIEAFTAIKRNLDDKGLVNHNKDFYVRSPSFVCLCDAI